MPEFRKKPVIIVAREFEKARPAAAGAAIALWCGGRLTSSSKPSDPDDIAYRLEIPTLEGIMTAHPGDWIIRGVQGEFYPCKPDIFLATYEPVEAPSDSGGAS